MADKKPLVAGQSPAVVQQIGPGDVLDAPAIRLGTPLAAQYGGLGVDPLGWTQNGVPMWNPLSNSFIPGVMPEASGSAWHIQYNNGTGGFASSPAFVFNPITETLNLYGELYVATTGESSIDPRMQMFTFVDKTGNAGVLRFQESALTTPVEFKFTGTAIETFGEFRASLITTDELRAHTLALTYNDSKTQLGAKTSPVVVHGSKFTITTSASAITSGNSVSFTITNSAIQDANAMIFVSHVSGGTVGAYSVSANVTGAGTAVVTISNITSGMLAQSLVLKGVVIG